VSGVGRRCGLELEAAVLRRYRIELVLARRLERALAHLAGDPFAASNRAELECLFEAEAARLRRLAPCIARRVEQWGESMTDD